MRDIGALGVHPAVSREYIRGTTSFDALPPDDTRHRLDVKLEIIAKKLGLDSPYAEQNRSASMDGVSVLPVREM